jgi:hypothetical protein
VCDTLEWAICPERYQALLHWGKNSPEGKLLGRFLRPESRLAARPYLPTVCVEDRSTAAVCDD